MCYDRRRLLARAKGSGQVGIGSGFVAILRSYRSLAISATGRTWLTSEPYGSGGRPARVLKGQSSVDTEHKGSVDAERKGEEHVEENAGGFVVFGCRLFLG
jgi:hypothetical protein